MNIQSEDLKLSYDESEPLVQEQDKKVGEYFNELNCI